VGGELRAEGAAGLARTRGGGAGWCGGAGKRGSPTAHCRRRALDLRDQAWHAARDPDRILVERRVRRERPQSTHHCLRPERGPSGREGDEASVLSEQPNDQRNGATLADSVLVGLHERDVDELVERSARRDKLGHLCCFHHAAGCCGEAGAAHGRYEQLLARVLRGQHGHGWCLVATVLGGQAHSAIAFSICVVSHC
jgi:hypothetical protein